MSKMCYPSAYTDLSSENTGRCYYTIPAPTNNSSYIGRVISFYFVFVLLYVGSFAQERKLICKLHTV